ncbi:sulfite exporter TauE/SafE family protein [Afifella sp. IM 167]|uniref:sulfite exporter TauE/SafE family protein n=1 Tax=Afifella sp. IM 167 TaxID=2033586 RepID=UPI001CCBFEBF|nr:sulfite exporter TauE/SafE family protein [Afifella sp. IM 167]MBZ8131752.1 permease [Afifella sp. IM 167]
MLTMGGLLVVLAGGFAGGFVTGLAGFGTGLVALGFWLHVIEPAPAATLVAICSVAAQAQTLPTIWHAVDRRRVWPMLAAGLLGVPLGTLLLTRVDIDIFRTCIGVFLIAFSAWMLFGRVNMQLRWGGRPADAVAGFAGGIMGGLAGLSAPIPTVWATLRGWGRDERRSVFQTFNLTILAAVVAWHFLSGLSSDGLGVLVLTALPGTFAGAFLGARTYRRLSDRRFHALVLVLLAVSGVTLVVTS